MSNYSVFVADAARAVKLRAWLDAEAAETEVLVSDLNRGRVLFLVARNVTDGTHGRHFFTGTVVSPRHGRIAFGAAAWNRLPGRVRRDDQLEGEFVVTDWNRRRVRVRRDVFANTALLHTTGPGVVGISDSLLVLKSLRDHLGLPVTQNSQVLLGRSLTNSHSAQQMSGDTYVDEIVFVPAGRHADVSLARLDVAETGTGMADRVVHGSRSGQKGLETWAGFAVGAVRALAERPGDRLGIGLSRAAGSRVLLAAAARAGVLDRVDLWSTSTNAADVRSAAALAAGVDSRLARPAGEDEDEDEDDALDLTHWAASSLGIRDAFTPRRTTSDTTSSSLFGTHAEVVSGSWGWTGLKAQLIEFSALAPLRRTSYANQVAKGIRRAGAETGWADASEIQYLSHRAGLSDAGRTSVSMTNIRLLQSLELARWAHGRTDAGRGNKDRQEATFRGAGDPIETLVGMLAPALGEGTASTTGTARLLPDSAIVRVHVDGARQDVPDGGTALGRSVARLHGYDLGSRAEDVLALAHAGVQAIRDEAARRVFNEVVDNARWRIETQGLPLRQAGPSVAKALSMAMFLR